MDEYISGELVAKAIGDDRELFNSYILGELTPFHLKMPQTFEQSCLPCVHAMDNGQPDPFRCDTDPDPERHDDVVAGYSRHNACGYGWLDDEAIISRLKRSSFRKNEIETFMRDMDLPPAPLSNAKTPVEYINTLREDGITDHDAVMVMLYEYSKVYHKEWKLRQWGAYCLVLGIPMPKHPGEKLGYGDEYKIRQRRYNAIRSKK
ncbi:MAG: hypothetical protein EOL87_17340 [Spartobacteria bacterium]|nr:hypothetical protein [Spartobacteria bacterium]